MFDGLALVLGVLSVISMGIFAFLGIVLQGRRMAGAMRLPAAQFALFWLGLAGVELISAIESLVAVAQVPPLALVLTLFYLEIALLCAILWGLLGYLVFLFTGRNFLVPITTGYLALYVALLYLVTAAMPNAVTVDLGVVNLHLASPLAATTDLLFVAALILPEIVASALYLSLAFRSADPTVRYRLGLVGGALLFWFSFAAVGPALLGSGVLGTLAGRVVAPAAAIVVILAYFPPARWRERGIRALGSLPWSTPRSPPPEQMP